MRAFGATALLLVASSAWALPPAVPVFDSLGASETFTSGAVPAAAGGIPEFAQAMRITPGAGGLLSEIRLPLSLESGQNEFILGLYTEVVDRPGNLLEEVVVSGALTATPAVVSVAFDGLVRLLPGAPYWVVLRLQTGVPSRVSWHLNDQGLVGLRSFFRSDVGWSPRSAQTLSAFRVSAVPTDGDVDDDGVPDSSDNCPFEANPGQEDRDGDGLGDVCDPDADGDGVDDATDNCDLPNGPALGSCVGGDPSLFLEPCSGDLDCGGALSCDRAQTDANANGIGDACEDDLDRFGSSDNCPGVFNEFQVDSDADGVGDLCDNCPLDPNPDQRDGDGNGFGDVCDGGADLDGDGWPNALDLCPVDSDPGQQDSDGDGVGNACDVCLAVSDPLQLDADGDGTGDACDGDDDGDGVADAGDSCPLTPNPGQEDGDGDGFGDACDLDGAAAPSSQEDAQGILDVAEEDIPGYRWKLSGLDYTPVCIGVGCDVIVEIPGPIALPGLGECSFVSIGVDGVTTLFTADASAPQDGIACCAWESRCGAPGRSCAPNACAPSFGGCLGGPRVGELCSDSSECPGSLCRVPYPCELFEGIRLPPAAKPECCDLGYGVEAWPWGSAFQGVDANGQPIVPDSEGDGVPDGCDSCPSVYNPDQLDTDGDGLGDACDPDGASCAGDVDGDGATGGADFAALLSSFNQSVPPGTGGDYDGNGIVGASDFSLLLGDFGCLPPACTPGALRSCTTPNGPGLQVCRNDGSGYEACGDPL